MRLFLEAQSERGKPVTKSGNEWIHITILDEKRLVLADIALKPNPYGKPEVQFRHDGSVSAIRVHDMEKESNGINKQ